MYKIGMISLGCPKNQVDGERMLAQFDKNGFAITDCYDGVDAVVINTCGFIDAAKQEAIENILEMAELKEEGVVGKIIVTGCLAQRYKDEILAEIPEVDTIVGIVANGDIADIVKKTIEGERFMKCLRILIFLSLAKDFSQLPSIGRISRLLTDAQTDALIVQFLRSEAISEALSLKLLLKKQRLLPLRASKN